MIEPRPTPRDKAAFAMLIAVLLAMPFACAPQAYSQDHADYHQHYMDWKRPHQPDTSCCSARREVDGEMQGDCDRTQAEPRPSSIDGKLVWWARRHGDGKWIEIPENRYVRYANPDPTGRDAHLCESHWMEKGREVQLIHCFRPPTGGS